MLLANNYRLDACPGMRLATYYTYSYLYVGIAEGQFRERRLIIRGADVHEI